MFIGQVYIFNKYLYIFHNSVANKIVICNGEDPSYFNNEIRETLDQNDQLLKQLINNGKLRIDYDRFQCIRDDSVESIQCLIKMINMNNISKNVKTQCSIYYKTTSHYISKLPNFQNFSRRLEKG